MINNNSEIENISDNITTTGITDIEINLLPNPMQSKISKKLTPTTKFILSYKAIFTEKYVQALKWKVPLIRISFLHNDKPNYDIPSLSNTQTVSLSPYTSTNPITLSSSFGNILSCDVMKVFEGVLFTTSGISNPIYVNYILASGGIYQPDCSIHLDFIISESDKSEKCKFCKSYSIPIIKCKDVFLDKFELFIKTKKYDKLIPPSSSSYLNENNSLPVINNNNNNSPAKIFNNLVFYIDDKLPLKLYNKLKRLILEYDGTRFPTISSSSLDYIITCDSYGQEFIEKYPDKTTLYYQFIFDCVANKQLLYCNSYKIYKSPEKCNKGTYDIFKNKVIVIGDDLSQDECVEYTNKIKAFGGKIYSCIDMRTTHVLMHKQISLNKSKQYQIVKPIWVDQSLTTLKIAPSDKYLAENLTIEDEDQMSSLLPDMVRRKKPFLFQFTGTSSNKCAEIKKKLKSISVNYSDSEKFENSCTHLVMEEVITSEKLFCSIASGVWIIKPDFIDYVNTLQDLTEMDFSLFEWVYRKTSEDSSSGGINIKNSSKHFKIIKAIKKWRVSVQLKKRKPYHKWVVKLYCNSEKYDGYRALIEAGGGVLTVSNDYTHVFVDKSYEGEVIEVKRHSTDYLFLYLLK